MIYNGITLNKGGFTMATKRVMTFECEQCGTEVVVNAAGDMELSPIYCCGVMVAEVPSRQKKSVKAKKKVAKKPVAKKVSTKKKTVTKKNAKK
jgi:hypothetical protein